MKFLYPLGLLGLIGIPILILIYIIKNKYQEKKIGSTYLWTLSEKFLKRRNPLTEISGLLSLILQLIVIICMSFAIAHPVFLVAGDAEKYVYVLDGSGSMNMSENGTTRFDCAKKEISDEINSAIDGSQFTLIYAGKTAETVISSSKSKTKVIDSLNKLTVTTLSYTIEDALSLAQNIFDEDKSVNIKVFSDKEYLKSENVELFDCYREEKNISLLDLSYTSSADGLSFKAITYSYDQDMSCKAELYLDDNLVSTEEISTVKEKKNETTFTVTNQEFTKAECRLTSDDALTLDDSYILYERNDDTIASVLLVSDQPFYLYSALTALENTEITVLYSDEYTGKETGYDIYIFDGIAPIEIPSDGSIWYVGENTNIIDSGFTIQEEVELDSAGYLTYEKSDDSTYEKITENTLSSSIAVGSYYKYSLTSDFTKILSLDSAPMLFVRTMSNNYREAVFSFDIHKSNLPVTFDFPVLISNLIDYSYPQAIEDNIYTCGDTLTIEKMPNSKSSELVSPSGVISYTNASLSYDTLVLTEVGTYKLTVYFENTSKEYTFYVLFPSDESNPFIEEDSISIIGNKEDKTLDSEYDNLVIVLVSVFVIMAIDWGVYCYEQHQLC